MKRKRFSEEKIIGVLKEHEAGAKVDDICRRHGISSATFYNARGERSRQRPRRHQQGDVRLVRTYRRAVTVHRARQAGPECLRRELQRQVPG